LSKLVGLAEGNKSQDNERLSEYTREWQLAFQLRFRALFFWTFFDIFLASKSLALA